MRRTVTLYALAALLLLPALAVDAIAGVTSLAWLIVYGIAFTLRAKWADRALVAWEAEHGMPFSPAWPRLAAFVETGLSPAVAWVLVIPARLHYLAGCGYLSSFGALRMAVLDRVRLVVVAAVFGALKWIDGACVGVAQWCRSHPILSRALYVAALWTSAAAKRGPVWASWLIIACVVALLAVEIAQTLLAVASLFVFGVARGLGARWALQLSALYEQIAPYENLTARFVAAARQSPISRWLWVPLAATGYLEEAVAALVPPQWRSRVPGLSAQRMVRAINRASLTITAVVTKLRIIRDWLNDARKAWAKLPTVAALRVELEARALGVYVEPILPNDGAGVWLNVLGPSPSIDAGLN